MNILIYPLIFLHLVLNTKSIELSEVRLLFHSSATHLDSCNKLITVLDQYNEGNNPTFAAYKACAGMMSAKYLTNPFDKLAKFNQGKILLEKCILIDNKNIEIRYLRFAIQSNTPLVLGYRSSIFKDKTVILSTLNHLEDQQLKQMIISYLMSSKYLSTAEKQNLKQN